MLGRVEAEERGERKEEREKIEDSGLGPDFAGYRACAHNSGLSKSCKP